MRKIKNFDDLAFDPVSEGSRTLKATLDFENGYGCNIYMFSEATNRWNPYEFELTKNHKPALHSKVSPDGNIGYCTQEDICDLIGIAQRL